MALPPSVLTFIMRGYHLVIVARVVTRKSRAAVAAAAHGDRRRAVRLSRRHHGSRVFQPRPDRRVGLERPRTRRSGPRVTRNASEKPQRCPPTWPPTGPT